MAVNGDTKSFLRHFAMKLAKINHERQLTTRYFPASLQYKRLLVSVKPLSGHKSWRSPRDIRWENSYSVDEFVNQFPELTIDAGNERMLKVLDDIKYRRLDDASNLLHSLEELSEDLNPQLQLKTLYDFACVESLRAEVAKDSLSLQQAVDRALLYLERWLALGARGKWAALGETSENEIHWMGRDGDLLYILEHHRDRIRELLGPERVGFLPDYLPHRPMSGGTGSGCVPAGTLVMTPTGPIVIEQIRKGFEVLSQDINQSRVQVVCKVTHVHSSRASSCIELNEGHLVSSSQPLILAQGNHVSAGNLCVGTKIRGSNGLDVEIFSKREITGYFNMYTITTDHPSHNYFAYGLVLGNKMIDPPERIW
jgi:hypothetical protein